MTGPELLSLLADPNVREQAQRLLGLPSDRVADRLEALAAAQAGTDATVKELAAAQARTDATVKELAVEVKELAVEVKDLAVEVKELAVEVKQLAQVGKETRQALGVKSRIYRCEVERFAARVERLSAELDAPIVPVLFGFVVHPSAIELAREADVLLVASKPSSAAA